MRRPLCLAFAVKKTFESREVGFNRVGEELGSGCVAAGQYGYGVAAFAVSKDGVWKVEKTDDRDQE